MLIYLFQYTNVFLCTKFGDLKTIMDKIQRPQICVPAPVQWTGTWTGTRTVGKYCSSLAAQTLPSQVFPADQRPAAR